VVGAPEPDNRRGDGLRRLDPAAYSSGGGVQVVNRHRLRRADRSGLPQPGARRRLLLLTGDLAAYSSARRAGSPATFKQLFPGGSWAAWVPLSVHLYDDGAGTRPD